MRKIRKHHFFQTSKIIDSN